MYEYWKNKLNVSCQSLYDKMIYAFVNMNDCVSCDSYDVEDIKNTYSAVCNDHPEFFYLSNRFELKRKVVATFLSSTTLVVKFLYDKKQIQIFNREIERIKLLFVENKQKGKDSLELEREIVDYCLQHFSYEVNNLYNQNAAALLVNNVGQCSGIAKAVKLLLDSVSIPTIVVSGAVYNPKISQYEPHAWNIVNIDGVAHHLDVTMMMGANEVRCAPFFYTHFNLADEEIINNYSWDKFDVPQCVKRMSNQNVKYSNEYQSNDFCGYFEVKSLIEFKQYLKENILQGKYDIFVKNTIKGYSTDNLMKLYCSSIDTICKQIGFCGQYELSVLDNILEIKIYKV